MFDLYYAQETCSLASHIVLEEVAATYRLHRIGIDSKDHHSSEYMAINPKRRVPALVTPDGVLTETPAILFYLANMFPSAKLAPLGDNFALAKLQEFNSYMASTLHVAHAHRMRGHRWVDDEAAIASMQEKVPETVSAAYKHIEEEYLHGPYVMGDAYSIADPYLFTFAQWMEPDGVNPILFPKVQTHRDMMRSRPVVQKVLEDQFR